MSNCAVKKRIKINRPARVGLNLSVLHKMDVLSRPAEEFENDQQVETLWAMKAFEFAEVYFNIISSVDPRPLRLTPFDDTIYKIFREEFPALNIAVVDEDEMKSPEGKVRWRNFCERFKKFVDDYSFGTLLRADASKDYTEQNSMLVSRVQFYAIELARNREGINDSIRRNFKRERKEEAVSDL